MKRIAFVIPYIGKLPNYFQLWLNSCSYNSQVSWLLFIDDKTPYRYPDNVSVTYVSFEWLHDLFQRNFDFDIYLTKPYKFCDFKPAYGEIFSEYLINFDFWGYCDLDLIWGDLNCWLTPSVLDGYNKISCWGHCSLYKNISSVNNLYKVKVHNACGYKQVFSSKYSYCFDENGGINLICKSLNIPYYSIPLFDVACSKLKFEQSNESKGLMRVPLSSCIASFCKGTLTIVGLNKDGDIAQQEFAYIHLQKRVMRVCVDKMSSDYFILPNRFVDCFNVNVKNILKVQPKLNFNSVYYKKKLGKLINRFVMRKEVPIFYHRRLHLVLDKILKHF